MESFVLHNGYAYAILVQLFMLRRSSRARANGSTSVGERKGQLFDFYYVRVWLKLWSQLQHQH